MKKIDENVKKAIIVLHNMCTGTECDKCQLRDASDACPLGDMPPYYWDIQDIFDDEIRLHDIVKVRVSDSAVVGEVTGIEKSYGDYEIIYRVVADDGKQVYAVSGQTTKIYK